MPPVDPTHIHADIPHEKTIAGHGYRYGCHNRPRQAVSVELMQDGWTPDGRRNMVKIQTQWLDRGCRHDTKHIDPACAGCPDKAERKEA